MASLIPPLLLGSPPISHEYYDPAEFMEGGPQEADRVDELEYEVSQAARAGPAASLRSQSPGWRSTAHLGPGSCRFQAAGPCGPSRDVAGYSGSPTKSG